LAKQELSRTLNALEGMVESRTKELTEEVKIRKRAEEIAAAASQAKSEFLSSMSHELRTPMNSVLGFSQLLATDPDDPLTGKQREFVEKILKNGDLLMSLINQILDLAKIEEGSVDLQTESIDASAMIEECVDLVQPLIGTRAITLETNLATATGVLIWADAAQVRQILLNLLSNAIKYNHDNGFISVSCDRTARGTIRILVADTGLGIPPAMQAAIFEPFNRLQQHNSAIEGTGIGLAISKKLAEQMNGSIGYKPQQDEGSLFWVELPEHESPRSPSVA